jgi:shikimate dehydrogenase
MHNSAFAHLGLNWVYGAFPVQKGDVPAALSGAHALGFRGLSVTMPHKRAAALAAEQASEKVEKLEVANTIVYRAGIAVAENTDGDGLVDDLRSRESFDPAGLTCGVIGAGGTARAFVLALYEAGATAILIFNRTLENAENAALLAPRVARVVNADDLAEAALIVNATPVGMTGSHAIDGEISSDLDKARIDGGHEGQGRDFTKVFSRGQLVVDSIYAPALSPFLAEAKACGARTRNGLGLLVDQAARQFELWTGEIAPRSVMWGAVQTHADS